MALSYVSHNALAALTTNFHICGKNLAILSNQGIKRFIPFLFRCHILIWNYGVKKSLVPVLIPSQFQTLLNQSLIMFKQAMIYNGFCNFIMWDLQINKHLLTSIYFFKQRGIGVKES